MKGPDGFAVAPPPVRTKDAGVDAPIDVLGLTGAEFAAAAGLALPAGAGVAPQLYRHAFREGRLALDRVRVSAASATAWAAAFRCAPLPVRTLVEEETSSGLTAKAVLVTADGYEIECVRIPMGDIGHTICISSQVGCRMGCAFCETGRMGLLRHLTAGEIVAQVVTARTVLGWAPRNIVFMGMGEALDNCDAVLQAIRVLTDQRGLHYSFERITVCTSGHAEGIARLAAQGWKRLNLSISLNAADDARRSQLMPVNRRTPLAELQRILAAYPQRRNFTLGVNWCLMPGFNDARDDAKRIAEFCRPLGRTLLNLIPYNPGNAPLTRAPSEDEVERFVGWLREEGVAVRRRVTKGRTIMAACGQLGNVELRRKRAAPRTAAPADGRA